MLLSGASVYLMWKNNVPYIEKNKILTLKGLLKKINLIFLFC